MEDRSALFNQLKEFSQRKLKKVETKVVTASGENLVEKRGAKGLQVLSGDGAKGQGAAEPARKLDLQVGFILPGLLIGSQDVAHDKSSLDTYGITHILNLDSEIENKFEDDYNYKNVNIQDEADFNLDKILDECFDFVDDGRHYGNVFVHCSGTIGLSRSTSICIAYLMSKERQKFDEAFNNVKEARSFVKPNEGFVKQLRAYEVKLMGAQKVKDSGIDDPFALRKKQEIEQEKAMVAGASSVKNRMKMFGATLDAGGGNGSSPANRSKSVSPSPYKTQPPPAPASPAPTSKWSSPANYKDSQPDSKSTSKSMTPEPRAKSWRDQREETKPDSWRRPAADSDKSSSSNSSKGPPPPPPPMPTSLYANDKSIKSLAHSNSANKSSLPPPPPPPPPPSGDIKKLAGAEAPSTKSSGQQQRVFGRVPPPPMKIMGGLSIEKHDPISDKNSGFTKTNQTCNSASILPSTTSHDHQNGNAAFNPRASHQPLHPKPPKRLDQRCESPLVLFNNTTSPQASSSLLTSPRILNGNHPTGSAVIEDEPHENPFKFWQNTLASQPDKSRENFTSQAPKRTVSLGPRRMLPPSKQIGDGLKDNPFIRDPSYVSTSRRESFSRAAGELQSSLTELNNLIEAPLPKVREIKDKFTSHLSSSNGNSPEKRQINYIRICNSDDNDYDEVEGALTRRASTSINDLRSMFESKSSQSHSTNTLPPPTSSSRPPRSASPSVLKNSPWQADQLSSSNSNQRQLLPPTSSILGRGQALAESDYAIRRTTSTTSRSTRSIRNPYRS